VTGPALDSLLQTFDSGQVQPGSDTHRHPRAGWLRLVFGGRKAQQGRHFQQDPVQDVMA